MKRALTTLATAAALLLPAAPANAMAYIQADPPQVSLVTKSSARLSCVFYVASGHTGYPQIFSYRRLADGTVVEKSYYAGGVMGGGTHRLTQDRSPLHSDTTYTVRCEATYTRGGPLAVQTARSFTTLASTDSAPAPRGPAVSPYPTAALP